MGRYAPAIIEASILILFVCTTLYGVIFVLSPKFEEIRRNIDATRDIRSSIDTGTKALQTKLISLQVEELELRIEEMKDRKGHGSACPC